MDRELLGFDDPTGWREDKPSPSVFKTILGLFLFASVASFGAFLWDSKFSKGNEKGTTVLRQSQEVEDPRWGCPRMENGECIPVEEAHQKAVAESNGTNAKSAVVHTNFTPDPREEEKFLEKEVDSFKTALRKFEFCMSKKRSEEACKEERDKLLDQFKTAEDRGRAKELHGVDMQERVVRLAAMESMVDRGSNTIPIRQPDTVLELHIMPYRTAFGALVSERVIWIVVQEGAWTWATTEGTDAAKPKIGALQ